MADKATKTFQKVADPYLSLSDVEHRIGTNIGDPLEQDIRDELYKKRQRSAFLRHPVATGIPTLGIGPYVAKEDALEDITSALARQYPKMRNRARAMHQAKEEQALSQQQRAIQGQQQKMQQMARAMRRMQQRKGNTGGDNPPSNE